MLYEIENELEETQTIMLKDRAFITKIKPLVTGDKVPHFNLINGSDDWRASVANQGMPGFSTSLYDLVEARPLVISFYCPCWGRYARPYLDSLITLSHGLRAVGAELLVFSNESPKSLIRQVGPVDFIVAHDIQFTVARRFGIYSEDDPIWDRISGISEEVFIPALYVVNGEREITYHALDEYFDTPLDLPAIIDQVLEVTPAI
jgi:peroxiredoxin